MLAVGAAYIARFTTVLGKDAKRLCRPGRVLTLSDALSRVGRIRASIEGCGLKKSALISRRNCRDVLDAHHRFPA